MKYLSLFSGIGGFEIGINEAYALRQNNFQPSDCPDTPGESPQLPGHPLCVGFSEIDRHASSVYQRHFPNHTPLGNVREIDAAALPDFDLLVGGFPCQAFSVAGKRLGFDDTRGTLFFEIARILAVKKPRNFVLENVRGLLSHDAGRTFRTILAALNDLGYCVEWQVLNSKDFGVPQNRERVYLVGHLGGIPRRKVFPICGADAKGYAPSGDTFPVVRKGRDFHERVVANTLDANYFKGLDAHQARTGISDGYRIRRLTPTECERLQAFPDGWTAEYHDWKPVSDTQRYKMLGNAVTTSVVAAVIGRLLAVDNSLGAETSRA